MNRVAAVSLLTILLLNIGGPYLYFSVRLGQIRKEMREELKARDASELEVLELSEEEFIRAKVDDHEIKVAGKMYDIARVERQNDNLLIYCLHDEKEDSLLLLLDDILKNASKDKKPMPSQIVDLSTLVFLIADIFSPTVNSLDTSHSGFLIVTIFPFFPSVDSPPPRILI